MSFHVDIVATVLLHHAIFGYIVYKHRYITNTYNPSRHVKKLQYDNDRLDKLSAQIMTFLNGIILVTAGFVNFCIPAMPWSANELVTWSDTFISSFSIFYRSVSSNTYNNASLTLCKLVLVFIVHTNKLVLKTRIYFTILLGCTQSKAPTDLYLDKTALFIIVFIQNAVLVFFVRDVFFSVFLHPGQFVDEVPEYRSEEWNAAYFICALPYFVFCSEIVTVVNPFNAIIYSLKHDTTSWVGWGKWFAYVVTAVVTMFGRFPAAPGPAKAELGVFAYFQSSLVKMLPTSLWL